MTSSRFFSDKDVKMFRGSIPHLKLSMSIDLQLQEELLLNEASNLWSDTW
jgi:hypothetical protein